ncbi:hypothetical protein QQF64_012172 [Cirrhinus molitorella]|uniref:Voltage-gated potassium channel subunit beta-1 n=1 Tax=Cirrhinus molitorella TaxID=172907 RepID=A0ABR3LUN3_9TELE
MQVSIACTDHNLKGRNGDHGKTNATSPNVVNAARAKFRTVAIIARSFGSFTPRHHISLKESTGKLTGMKYRYVSLSPFLTTFLYFHFFLSRIPSPVALSLAGMVWTVSNSSEISSSCLKV